MRARVLQLALAGSWLLLAGGPAAGQDRAALPASEPEELECLIGPRSRVSLSAPVEGLIEAIHVERGDRVEKGQLLVELESSLERAGVAVARERARSQAAVKESEVRLAYAKRQHDRHEDLARTEVIASQKLDEVTSSLEIAEVEREAAEDARKLAQLELERAEALLARRRVVSPVDGLVAERILDPGEYAEKQPILELVELDPLHVEVFVPLLQLGAVAVGDTLVVRPEPPVGGEYEARVTVVDSVVDAASGTFRVRLDLPNPGYALPAGIGCRVRLPGAGRRAAGATDPGSARAGEAPDPTGAAVP